MERKYTILAGDEVIEEGQKEVTWESLRISRDQELKSTDWWALKDLTMSQDKKDYRKFLRDLPSNFDTANEAADAWAEYEKPE